MNEKTIRRASSRLPCTEEQNKLAVATWKKVVSETSKGRVGEPIDLDKFDLSSALSVDTFGIWERRGGAVEDSLRIINNFKANRVNEFAYMPEKLSYDGFAELHQTCQEFRRRCTRKLRIGKTDFR